MEGGTSCGAFSRFEGDCDWIQRWLVPLMQSYSAYWDVIGLHSHVSDHGYTTSQVDTVHIYNSLYGLGQSIWVTEADYSSLNPSDVMGVYVDQYNRSSYWKKTFYTLGGVSGDSCSNPKYLLCQGVTPTPNFAQYQNAYAPHSQFACVLGTSPSSVSVNNGLGNFDPAVATGAFTLNASNCDASDIWVAVPSAAWLMPTATAGNAASSSITINYSLFANTTSFQRSGTITVGGNTFTVSQMDSASEPFVNREVRALYHSILFREPDSGGFQFWTGAGSGTLYEMADGFIGSPEFYNAGYMAAEIYQEVFGRLPTMSEWLQAGNYLRANGRTPAAQAQLILTLSPGSSPTSILATINTPSYETTSVQNELYVTLLYQSILLRDTDPSGLSFWLSISNSWGNGVMFPCTSASLVSCDASATSTRYSMLGYGGSQGFMGSSEFQGLIQ